MVHSTKNCLCDGCGTSFSLHFRRTSMLNPYDKHLIATIAVIGTLLLANACHAEFKSTKIPRYDAAVAKAVSFLQRAQKVSARDSTLVAYALLKAGVPQSDPKIVAGLQRAKDIAAANDFGSYHPLYCLLYTSPSPRDQRGSRMPSSA